MGKLSDFLGAITGTKYADRLRQERYEHDADELVMKAALEGRVPVEQGRMAFERIYKTLPKDAQPGFAQFGQHVGFADQPALPTPPQASPAPTTPGTPMPAMDLEAATGAVDSPAPPPALPAPPSANGGYVQGQGQNGAGSPPSQGMMSLRPLPAFDVYSPEEQGRRAGLALGAQTLAQSDANMEVGKREYAAKKARYENEPWFKSLSPRQQAMVLSGTAITPEFRPTNLPGMVKGESIPDSTQDAFGAKIDPSAMYRVRINADGTREYFPEVASSSSRVMPDQNSTTGFSLVFYDRTGHELSRTPNAAPPPAFTPTSTYGSHETVVEVEDPDHPGNLIKKVETLGSGSTRVPRIPGITPPPNWGRPTASPTPSAPSNGGGGGRGGRILGKSGSQVRAEWENPLTPQAQRTLEENEPVLAQVSRAMSMLDKVKDVNQPLNYAVERLGYSAGMATEASQLINNLELGKVIGAARVMKGSSRAIQALEIAMTHLPNPKTDSPKLMYEKLQNIKQNLDDIAAAAKKYGVKRPGLPNPPKDNNADGAAKIRVKRKSDGATGTINESDFDSAKYERI